MAQVPAPALAALVRPHVAGAWHRGDGAPSGGEGGDFFQPETPPCVSLEKHDKYPLVMTNIAIENGGLMGF